MVADHQGGRNQGGMSRGDSFGSIPAANFRDRHGRTCSKTGRQDTQPLRRLLIDEMTASTNGRRFARSTSITGRRGRRGWIRRWARSRLPRRKISGTPPYVNAANRCNFIRELPAGPAVVPPINGSVGAVGRRTF
jgi:hypothetical protein